MAQCCIRLCWCNIAPGFKPQLVIEYCNRIFKKYAIIRVLWSILSAFLALIKPHLNIIHNLLTAKQKCTYCRTKNFFVRLIFSNLLLCFYSIRASKCHGSTLGACQRPLTLVPRWMTSHANQTTGGCSIFSFCAMPNSYPSVNNYLIIDCWQCWNWSTAI